MQAPTVNRNTGNVIAPEATARADNPSNIRQQTEQPTQRSSHSLGSMGKRLLKSVGKVFQKSRAPRQSAARPPSTQPPSSSPPRSSREAGRNTSRDTRLPDNPPPRDDPPPKSILRTRANTSGTTKHEIERGSTRADTAPRNNRRVTFNLPQDQLTYSPSEQLAAEPMTDEEAVASAMRERRNPGGRLQGPDGTRESMQPVDPNTASSSGTQADDPDGPLARRNTGLESSTGGSSELRSEQLMRDTRPQATIRLSADGKPDFSSFKTPGMAALLNDILAKPGQTYLAQQSEQGVQDHQLLQANGHLLHLAQGDSSLAVIRSSEPTLPVAGGKPPPVNMQREENHIHLDTLDGRRSQELPGKAHIAHLTDVHQTTNGDRLRVHEDRLCQFEPLTARWKPVDEIEDIAFNRLITGGNGSVYAKSDDVVVDLSSPFMRHADFKGLKSFSVAPDDTAALLSGSDVQTVLLTDMSPVIGGLTPKKTKTLELDGGQAQAAEVALSNDRLFIADTQGRLYSTDRSAFESNEPTLRLMPERAGYRLDDQPMGGHNSVSGFISGDDGRVHALIRNRQGEVHSHALDEQGAKLEIGWNLTNALVLDNTRGLTVMPAPVGA
ncbi:AvrE-family type 3 secretion system effector, partial [Pseudomonas syringae]